MNLILLTLLLLLPISPPSKQEVETTAKASDLPAASLALLTPMLNRATDVRYFRESDGQSRSYEVKFWLDGARWSVEFSADGTFEDVEVERTLTDLPSDTAAAIRATLRDRFSKHTVRKLQIQYTTWPPDLGSPMAYELIVEGTTRSELGVFELKLDTKGSIVSERRVIEIPDL
jgi:hypothetical protein